MIFFNDSISPVALSVRDAVRLSGISRSALYLRIAEGVIDARKAGGRTLIMADSLQKYIKSLPRSRRRTEKPCDHSIEDKPRPNTGNIIA